MKVTNFTKQTTLAEKTEVADTFIARMKGLLYREGLNEGEGLLITRCQSIHMFFMRFAIDVVFADKEDQVVGLCVGIKPFRLSPIFLKSSYCIELPAGSIEKSQTVIGDRLKLE